MDSRLFYDLRKIFRKIFQSKKISVDLKENNDMNDEKNVSVTEVILFIKHKIFLMRKKLFKIYEKGKINETYAMDTFNSDEKL
jgi:hypothetical protein